MLIDELRQVDDLQKEATRAVEDLVTGRRDDVESVLMATTKADLAFRMLQQVRNKALDAYTELKDMSA